MCSCLSFCRMRREYCNPAAVRNNRFESRHFLTVRLVFLSATEKPSLPVVRPTSISRSRLFRLPRGSNQKHCRERKEGGGGGRGEGEREYNDACRTVRRTRFRRDCSAAFTFDLSALYLQQITRISPPVSLSTTRFHCTCTGSPVLLTWPHALLIAYPYFDYISINETV